MAYPLKPHGTIYCVDCTLADALREAGCEVVSVALQPGLHSLASLPGLMPLLEQHKLALFVQREHISGHKTLITGLESLPCPTVYMPVDVHLNLYWQQHYARLFDMVLTPHLTLFEGLPRADRHPQVFRFSHWGVEHAFISFEERTHGLAFCGRLDAARPARAAMVKLLQQRCGLTCPEAPLPFPAMLDMFGQSRILPNECIAGEVNYRLFEGASCGCLMLSPDIGEDQNSQFVPGKEFEPYAHSQELLEKIAFYTRCGEAAQKIARAGWERIRSDHLPRHRAAQLLHSVKKVSKSRLAGNEAGQKYWQAVLALHRNGSFVAETDWLLAKTRSLPQAAVTLGMELTILAEAAQPLSPLYSTGNAVYYEESAHALCQRVRSTPALLRDLRCALPAAMFHLAAGRASEALDFLPEQSRAAYKGVNVHDACGQYLAWADLLEALGYETRNGFRFRLEGGFLPLCALEAWQKALFAAQSEDDCRWLEPLCRSYERHAGYEWQAAQYSAMLSLYHQKNWREQVRYALNCIKSMQPERGLHELRAALRLAEQNNESPEFIRTLAAAPSSRYILQWMKRR